MGDPDSTIVGTIVSIFHIGAFLGAIFTSIVGERLGRRRTLICGTAIDTVGAILQCTSYGQAQMFVGRIISGLGNAISCVFEDYWYSFLLSSRDRNGDFGCACISVRGPQSWHARLGRCMSSQHCDRKDHFDFSVIIWRLMII